MRFMRTRSCKGRTVIGFRSPLDWSRFVRFAPSQIVAMALELTILGELTIAIKANRVH